MGRAGGSKMLFLRALLAFLALPGLVAFAAPLLLIWPRPLHAAFRASGLAVLAVGVVYCGASGTSMYPAAVLSRRGIRRDISW